MRKQVEYIQEDNSYIFECPHCNILIQVLKQDVNCKIFRHGVFKNTRQHVDPHLSKELCDRLKSQDLVYGCCKPFKLIIDANSVVKYAQECAYI